MKRITLAFLMLFCISTLAQQRINYKALIKDGSGNVVANQNVTVQLQIFQGVGMANVYQETHTINTDANGIVMLNIGGGTVNSGDYSTIDWGSDAHHLNVQINTGSGLTDMGTTQFMAVPYALSAGNAATKIDDLSDGKSDANGTSVFLGVDAGLNDDGTNNNNVGIGLRALQSNTTGNFNVANGANALYSNTTGSLNVANGASALRFNTTGNNNVANGTAALILNTTGLNNVANGAYALRSNTTGGNNVANGNSALTSNTTGDNNVANGADALYSNTTGFNNSAVGFYSLFSNTTGFQNVANGAFALLNNTTGGNNTAIGYESLKDNNAPGNSALGHQALLQNTSGSGNTAVGFRSMFNNTTGGDNVANGIYALYNNTTGGYNVVNGRNALLTNTTGNNNVAYGTLALSNNTTGSNNIGIGYNAQVPNGTLSNQVRIGNTSVSYAGVQVGWTITSDKRWKDNIRALPYGLNMVNQLQPVDYIRKNNVRKTREIGFIAQDVETLLKSLEYDDQGLLHKDDKGFMSLRYNDFIPVLVKAIQEQQEIIASQDAAIKKLMARMEKVENKTGTN